MSPRARMLAFAILVVALALVGDLLAQEMKTEPQPSQEPAQRQMVEPPPRPDGIEGFGAVKWGMSIDEVARYFPSAERPEEGGLHVSMAIGGKPTEAYFVFRGGKLVIIAGRYTNRYSDLDDYVDEYNQVVEVLQRELLKPVDSEEIWTDDAIEQNDSEKGRAVATGQLRLKTRWETPKTYVDFTCTGGNYQVYRTIRFQSRELGNAGAPGTGS